jgi:hypothetical protein
MSFLSCLSSRKPQATPPRNDVPSAPARAGSDARWSFTKGLLTTLKTAALAQESGSGTPQTVADTLDALSRIPTPDGDAPAPVGDIVARQLADMPAADRRVMASWYATHKRELAAHLQNRVAMAQAAAHDSPQDGQLALRSLYAVSIQLRSIGSALADMAISDIDGAGLGFDLMGYEDALRSFLKGVAGFSVGSTNSTALSKLLDTVVAVGGASRALNHAELTAYHGAMDQILAEFDGSQLKAIAEELSRRSSRRTMAEVPADQSASAFGIGTSIDAYAGRELAKLKSFAEARLRADAYVRGTLGTLCDAVFANAEVATREKAYDSHLVLQALYALPPPDRASIPAVEAIVAKQLAEMPPTLRRMLGSWFARHARDMVKRLEAPALGQPGPSTEESSRWSGKLTPRDAACVHLRAVKSALQTMAEQDYRAATNPFNVAAYQGALRNFLNGIVAPSNGSVDAFTLARRMDKVIALGAATRKPDEKVRQACRSAMSDVLAALHPSELKTVLASFYFTEGHGGTRAPALLGTFISNDSYAEAELLWLHNCVAELAKEDEEVGPTSTKHFKLYFERRAATIMPLLERLVAGARDVAGGRGADKLINAQRTMSTLEAARRYLQAPLFSDDCVVAFHQLQSDLGALFRHCPDTLQKIEPPDMAGRLGNTVMHRCKEMLTIAGMGAPCSDAQLGLREAEMSYSVRCMVEELASVRTTLHQQALARLERAQDRLVDLDQWLDQADRLNTAEPVLHDVPAVIDRMIDDVRVVSDVAKTGWKPERPGILRERLATLLGRGSHFLSNAQLERLARCDGIGMPMTHICDLARTINGALLASVKPQSPSDLAKTMRTMANGVLAMDRYLAGVWIASGAAALGQGVDDKLIHAVQAHAEQSIGRMLNDVVSRLDPRQHAALRKRLTNPDCEACRRIARRLPAALCQIQPGGTVGGFAHPFVIEGFKAGISLWAAAFCQLGEAVQGAGKSTQSDVALTPKQWHAAYNIIGAAVGVRAEPGDERIAIVALENAEFYVIRGDMPKRAVISDYTLSGRPFKVCSNTATNRRTLSKGSVEVRFPGIDPARGQPESVIVNEQLWTDIHRARFVIDDITLTGKSFAPGESLDITQGSGKRFFVDSRNPQVYRFLTKLQTICREGDPQQHSRQYERQLDTVSALMSQALAASMLSVTMGGEVGYGWFGRGAFIKRHGDTDIEYHCKKTRPGVVTIKLLQNEAVTMISPKLKANERPPQAGPELARQYSVARYEVTVEVANGKPDVPVNAAKLKFALVEA